MRDLLATSGLRTFNPFEARLFYIPLWEVTSTWIGKCNGTDHEMRMSQAANALQRSRHFIPDSHGRAAGYNHMFVTTGCDELLKGELEHAMKRLGPSLGPLLANSIVGRDHACALSPLSHARKQP